MNRVDSLRRKVRDLQDEGSLPTRVTQEQAADWAYGNTKIENDNVTFEMAQVAAERSFAGK